MVKIFIEGGGESDALKTECRRAFTRLLEKAGFKGRMPRLVACGGRASAYKQFCTALGDRGGTELAILLVDAEGPVTHASPWAHVRERKGDQWSKPPEATDDHLHLMVECMEAWFLADRPALLRFYGQGFSEGALPVETVKPESVSKLDVYDKLERASRTTKTKGHYGKSSHSFKLVAELDPKRIRERCPWADRFFATLERLLVPG